MNYRELIATMARGYDARLIEAWMRLQYGTLDHLSRTDFAREIAIAIACIDEDPKASRELADSILGREQVAA